MRKSYKKESDRIREVILRNLPPEERALIEPKMKAYQDRYLKGQAREYNENIVSHLLGVIGIGLLLSFTFIVGLFKGVKK